MTGYEERERHEIVRQLEVLGELEEKGVELLLKIVADQLAEDLLPRLGRPTGDFPGCESTFDLSGRVTVEQLTEIISESEAWRLLCLSIVKIQGDSEWMAGWMRGEKQ